MPVLGITRCIGTSNTLAHLPIPTYFWKNKITNPTKCRTVPRGETTKMITYAGKQCKAECDVKRHSINHASENQNLRPCYKPRS